MDKYIAIILFVLIFGILIKINKIEERIQNKLLEKFEIKDENAKQQLLSILGGGNVNIGNLNVTGKITAKEAQLGELHHTSRFIARVGKAPNALEFGDDGWLRTRNKHNHGQYMGGFAGDHLHAESNINSKTIGALHSINTHHLKGHDLHLRDSAQIDGNINTKGNLEAKGNGKFHNGLEVWKNPTFHADLFSNSVHCNYIRCKNDIDCNIVRAKHHRVKDGHNCNGHQGADVDIRGKCHNRKDVGLELNWVKNPGKYAHLRPSVHTHQNMW